MPLTSFCENKGWNAFFAMPVKYYGRVDFISTDHKHKTHSSSGYFLTNDMLSGINTNTISTINHVITREPENDLAKLIIGKQFGTVA